MRKGIIISLGLILVLVPAIFSGCTPNEVQKLEGIIQNVDTVKGEITIVTKDGKMVTLDIDTGASVETEGGLSNLETLEIGAYIQVDVNEDNQVVQRIKARQKEIAGEIVQIAGDEVTVESENGQRVTILISDDTRIESEDDSPGTSSTLQVGDKIETRFDPESKVAFAINGQGERAEADDSSDKETEPESGTVSEDVEGEKDTGIEIDGDVEPDGDVDIDGDGKITIVDVVGGMEAERERLAEEIRIRMAAGEVDAEWVREVEAERERLAEEIRRALSDDTKIVIIDGRAVIIDIDPIGDPDPVIDPPEDGDHPGDGDGGVHPDDGDDHPDDGDNHPDDGDDHPDDGDDHPDDDDDHSDDDDDH